MRGEGKVNSPIFYTSYDDGKIFWPVRKHKKSRAIFQDFYPGKKNFESSIQDSWTENFEIMFFEYQTKNIASEFQGLWQLCFSVGEIPGRPSDPTSSHPKNNVSLGRRAVSVSTNWKPKTKHFER